MIYEVVQGWTGVIDVDLLSGGATPSGTMAGMSVELILKDQNSNAMPTTGDVSIQDPVNWIVRYSPDPTDLVAGIYHGRFKVTDAAGLVVYFPSGAPDKWVVFSET